MEDLVIYHGKLKPVFSAPCENWFEDNDPLEKVPTGYIAIRQLNSGCLAFLPKDKHDALDLSENKRERLDRSKKRRSWPWNAADLMDIIISFFRLPW